MRISADVLVSNRALCTHNIKGKVKPVRSSISIGKKSVTGSAKESEIFILVCTAQNRGGTKYEVRKNVQGVFTKFAHEGKATIRLIEPQLDICIQKADVVPLKAFLNVLGKVMAGRDVSQLSLSAMNPASAAQVTKPVTVLNIKDKRDYPMTSNFPSSLEILKAPDLNLNKIDSRIFKLKHLTTLDLASNSIKEIPPQIRDLKLRSIILSENRLTELPVAMFTFGSNLVGSLVNLSLAKNGIKRLPEQICYCSQLHSLNMNDNQLTRLPIRLGTVQSLQVLKAANNQLKYLPGTMLYKQLDSLDIAGNSFETFNRLPQILVLRKRGDSLIDHCLRTIDRSEIDIENEILPKTLIDTWRSRVKCACGKWCFIRRLAVHVCLRVSKIAQTISVPNDVISFELILCSQDCITKFTSNLFSL
ncbi:hypothetical protein TCAL_12935 [Tigriopus californicus]|uniref:PIF1/LRR1 pleckstrin homology domain-containing protein n=1 Tax=Tigriopus californicus TaxID=6832 RepID=A0A553PLA8_TIGCA|nr:leucine-rich repeat protein 1-like [Tigriopus californicus]TRY78467.1 hypothetical protein TCAL_12935 [Tigriopus californicus]|eukprot:TCALIF_12935-PA protein Name:"Similar to LRR1 Leucine-rich repeat protein 1 (Homo sapiens)" AED:0.31 eAED:0.31 QI:0/-1/0/1/-1/1/1/0/417